MNLKETVIVLSLSIVTVWAINFLFFGKKSEGTPGVRTAQVFTAPTGEQQARPLNTEIDFIDTKRPAAATLTEIETDGARYVFSSDGATLEQLEFKVKAGVLAHPIDTIFPVLDTERERRCFLLAFDEKTPFYYTMTQKVDDSATVFLDYRAETDDVIVTKKFAISKSAYKIDLIIIVEPKHEQSALGYPRIFYPCPIMPDLKDSDIISAVVGGDQGRLTKIAKNSINLHEGWMTPTLFGTDSRYFVHALVSDKPQSFCRRAYYKIEDGAFLTSIIEGPALHNKVEQQYNLSFYFGPKELNSLNLVDSRLEQTLDYSGIFGSIAKWLLLLLNLLFAYVHNYGLAIILLTLLVKLILLPFSIKADSSNQKRLEFQKKLDYIKHRYKDDPARIKQEQAELISKHGFPGLAGCLPLLLQIPVFWILSRVLSSSIDLYKASFLWIPDLASKDPWYILPILITVSMVGMMLTTPSRQKMQATTQLSSLAMALFFGAMSTTCSAGLALYIFVSTLLGVIQAMFTKRFV